MIKKIERITKTEVQSTSHHSGIYLIYSESFFISLDKIYVAKKKYHVLPVLTYVRHEDSDFAENKRTVINCSICYNDSHSSYILDIIRNQEYVKNNEISEEEANIIVSSIENYQ